MHTTACQLLLLLVGQAVPGQFSPGDNLQMQPIPMSVDLNAPTKAPVIRAPKTRRIHSGPATLIDEPTNPVQVPAEHRVQSEQRPTLSQPGETMSNRERFNVAPISYDEPIRQVAYDANSSLATSLISLSLDAAPNEKLPGRPLPLMSALSHADDRGQQLAVIKAYWQLSARVANYRWAIKEVQFLTQIQARDATDNAFLSAAREEAKAREQETRLAATAAQYELAELARIAVGNEVPPLPADLPFVGQYRTNYQAIYANRTPSSNVARLANMIPISHELVETRANAATTAFTAMQATEEASRKGQAHMADVLKSFERLNSLRQAFVASVRDYNQTIAEYSLTVVSTSIDRQTLVSTLIRTPLQAHPTNAIARGPGRAGFGDSQQQRQVMIGENPVEQPRAHARIVSGNEVGGQPHQGGQPVQGGQPAGQWRQPHEEQALQAGNRSTGGGAFLQPPPVNNPAQRSQQSPLDREDRTLIPAFPARQ